jgi:ubiquinol-cytochrome c reductase cytochrome c1 subunit
MTGTFLRLAAAALLALPLASPSRAQEDHAAAETPHYPLEHPRHVDWSFSGPFGKYDPQQLQRGFQIYRDVCAACHSMNMVAFRNLADPGGPLFTHEQAEAIAASYQVTDGPDESGEMFERPGRPSDYFPAPFPNEQAARASNGGALPPDMSLLAKARAVSSGFPMFLVDLVTQYQEHGPDYIYSLLTGYQEAPAGVELQPGQYYNPYFIAGPALAMPPPLADGQVSYAQNQDETDLNNVPETVDQYSKDVTAFLMWAAEPHMAARKAMGLTVMIYLIILAGLVYYTKKKVWATIPGE